MPSVDFSDMLAVLGAKRIGTRAWIACCPAHEDHSPSLTIYEGNLGQPIFVCGRCEWRDVRDSLRERGCKIVAKKPRRKKGDPVEPPPVMVPSPPPPDYSRAAMKLWKQSVSGRGTPVEVYLRGRGLMPVLQRFPDMLSRCLRFHVACPKGRGKEAQYVPAMLALMRDIVTDEPVAIHRTFLGDGRKLGKPMMLGPCEHAAVKLTAHVQCFPPPLMMCSRLHVAEGIETALAAMQLFEYVPMWALGSAGAIERLPVLDDVGELVVCADHDKVGRRAATIAEGTWLAAGASAKVMIPDAVGADFADLVQR